MPYLVIVITSESSFAFRLSIVVPVSLSLKGSSFLGSGKVYRITTVVTAVVPIVVVPKS